MQERGQHLQRYYVPTDSIDTAEGARIGVSWLSRLERSETHEPLVVIPNAAQAASNEHVERATRRYWWITAVAYRSASAQGWTGGPVLLICPPNAHVLDWFDRHKDVLELCVVQGTTFDTTAWARATQPIDLTTGAPFPPGSSATPVVERALQSVDDQANARLLGTKRDVEHAIASLTPVLQRDHSITPADLEAWALANGWSLEGARRLADRVARIALEEGESSRS